MGAAIQIENGQRIRFFDAKFRNCPSVFDGTNVTDVDFVNLEVDNSAPDVLVGDLDSFDRYLEWVGMPDTEREKLLDKMHSAPKSSWRLGLTEWVQILTTTGLAMTQVEKVAAGVAKLLG